MRQHKKHYRDKVSDDQILNKRFDNFIVLGIDQTKIKRRFFVCQCDCGRIKSFPRYKFLDKLTCQDCNRRENVFKQYINTKIGKLKILDFKTGGPHRKTLLLTKCDCGEITWKMGELVRNGHTNSCGKCSREKDINHYFGYIGQKINDFEIIGVEKLDRPKSGKYKILYLTCKCKCGIIGKRTCGDVLSGRSKRCNACSGLMSRTGFGDISGSYFSYFKTQARLRKINFEVSIEYLNSLWKLQDGKCAYSGDKLILNWGNKDTSKEKHTASLDRIDSSKGYIEGNLQWVHKIFQLMKMDLEENEFLNACVKLVKYKKLIGDNNGNVDSKVN